MVPESSAGKKTTTAKTLAEPAAGEAATISKKTATAKTVKEKKISECDAPATRAI